MTMKKTIPAGLGVLATTLALALMLVRPAIAEDGPVLLTVDTGAGTAPVTFTDDDLMALEQQSFVTSTLWTTREQEFSGPALRDVLKAAGATEPFWIEMVAANDYAVTIGPDMIDRTYPIVTTRIDGAPFTIREKGPLWLLYPFDKKPEYKRETHYSASIWQLTHINVTTPQSGAITQD